MKTQFLVLFSITVILSISGATLSQELINDFCQIDSLEYMILSDFINLYFGSDEVIVLDDCSENLLMCVERYLLTSGERYIKHETAESLVLRNKEPCSIDRKFDLNVEYILLPHDSFNVLLGDDLFPEWD